MRPVRGKHMSAIVAIGETAHKQGVKCSPRNHAQLAEFRNSIGKAPIRHAYTHTALDYFWELDHL